MRSIPGYILRFNTAPRTSDFPRSILHMWAYSRREATCPQAGQQCCSYECKLKLLRCSRYTKFCWVGKHINIVMKPSNSTTQPNSPQTPYCCGYCCSHTVTCLHNLQHKTGASDSGIEEKSKSGDHTSNTPLGPLLVRRNTCWAT